MATAASAVVKKPATAKMSIFMPVYMDQRVALTPSEYSKATGMGITAYLEDKIRQKLEGQCCAHGYVRPGSTKIQARSMGQAEHGRFTGDFLFLCKVKVECLLPHVNQMFECRVLTMNKLGAYVLIVDGGRLREAMRILVPRDLHLDKPEFDALQVGQGIRVRLLRSRFQTNDPYIQGVGMFMGMAPAADAKEEAETGEEGAVEGVEGTMEGVDGVAEGATTTAPQMVVQEVATAAT